MSDCGKEYDKRKRAYNKNKTISTSASGIQQRHQTHKTNMCKAEIGKYAKNKWLKILQTIPVSMLILQNK